MKKIRRMKTTSISGEILISLVVSEVVSPNLWNRLGIW
jgi:hypothetical protein